MPLADRLPIYIVVGSEPDKPIEPLEIFMEPERADAYVLDGLITSLAMHRSGVLQQGEQISLIMTIGDRESEPEKLTAGSVVVVAKDHRHVWDFRVEKRWAPR